MTKTKTGASHPAKRKMRRCSCGSEYGWNAPQGCPHCRYAKVCRSCETSKPLAEFSRNVLAADGRQWCCAACRRDQARLARFGLTRPEFDDLRAQQNDRCALCDAKQPGGRNNEWHVDHDHGTGKVRGLLCCGCNIQLGIYEKFTANPKLEAYLDAA